jgi:hypothetical protein
MYQRQLETTGGKAEEGTKKALKGLEKVVQKTTESTKKIFEWFKDFFTKGENAKLKQSLLGGFVGFLTLTAIMDRKKEKTKKPKRKKTRAELKKEVERKKVTDLDERIKKEAEEPMEILSDFEKIRKDKSLSKSEKIIKIAHLTKERGLVRKNCWDFVAKVYKLAGFARGGAIFSTIGAYKGKNCGENYAKDNVLNNLKPGDHIFVNNRNKADNHGNHSVIFLGWKNRKKGEARIMGYYAKKQSFSEYTKIIKGVPKEEWAKMSDAEKRKINPVTKIMKPV